MNACWLAIITAASTSAFAQFYAPDTEYHDPVQRVFAVEAARVLSWLDGLQSTQKIAEVTYSVTTRPDQTTVWNLQSLDAAGQRVAGAKVEYTKDALKSGPEFYRNVFGQLWRAKILNQPLRSVKADEVLSGFWTGAELAGFGREETLTAALRLVSTNLSLADVPQRAGPLAGLLAHAALPSTADHLTLDNVVLARAALWLALAEQCASAKLDRLWAPILFFGGRDQVASKLWQKEVAAGAQSSTPSEKYWNLILRGSSTREAYLFATEQKNFGNALSLLAYDVRVNQSAELLGDLLPDLSGNVQTLMRAHNYGPLLAVRTTIGGGHILNGAWPYFSRIAFFELLESFPDSAPDAALFKAALGKVKSQTQALRPREHDADASSLGFKEATPLLHLAHKEGVGKLRPCAALTVRDALNYGWEMGGLQMGARTIFVTRRWGIRDEGDKLFKTATAEVEGWMPFFVNQNQTPVATYPESLLRLQMVDGTFYRVGYSPNPYGKTLSKADAARLWIKRCWMRPSEFEWQARTMWDVELLAEQPDLILALHEEAGARAAVEILSYFRQINANDFKKIPRGREQKLMLADALPNPTVLWLNAVYERDFNKLDPYERGLALEKQFWRNPDGGLEDRVLRSYLSHPAYKAARQFYVNMRENITDTVKFSNGPGQLLWMAGYMTNDKELRAMALENSESGSHADMMLNIWEHAVNGDEKKLAVMANELIERYEPNGGNDSLGRTLQRFLPLLPALKDPKHRNRAEALRFFGKSQSWTILRWIWIEKYKVPAADAITFLGGRENDQFRSLLIAVLEKDQPKALEYVNAFNASRGYVDEYSLLSQHAYSKLHPLRPEPEAPVKALKPKDFTFTRQAVLEKLEKRGANTRADSGRQSGDFAGRSQGIDFARRFVRANPDDAREAHGQAAGMARAGLKQVEGDFQDHVRLDGEIAAALPDDAFQEVLR
jgi:hypothetical protein